MQSSFRRHLPRFLRAVPTHYLIGGGVALAVVLVIGVHHFTKGPSAPSQDAAAGTPHVQLSSVAGLAAAAGPLSTVGTVDSQSQATILAQTSGEIVSLSHAIGDQVAAGEEIGRFENSSQQAAVVQAQGAYDAAQVALAEAQGTTAANSGITSTQAAQTAQNDADSLVSALRSAYSALDDAVHTRADLLFTNPRSITRQFDSFTVPDSQLINDINNGRAPLDQLIADAQDNAFATSSALSLDARASNVLSDAGPVESFLNNVADALSQAVPDTTYSSATIAADQTSIATARTEVTSAISAVTAAKSTYDSAEASAQSAGNSASGGVQSSIATAEASLKSAQGALESAQAALEKTIIRSPISGTIVSLPITQGDYVSSNAQVAIVSNPNALYVDANVTPQDAQTLEIGGSATVNGTIPGTITFIAPSLDPSTGDVEVKVGFPQTQGSLEAGEAVSIDLTRRPGAAQPVGNSSAPVIPINAIKVLPTGAAVFTVSASSTLVSHQITLGSILDNRVAVTSGLTSDMQIVTDARGLSDGESVIVDSSASSTPL